MKSMADRIRQARSFAKLPQSSLAAALGVHRCAVTRTWGIFSCLGDPLSPPAHFCTTGGCRCRTYFVGLSGLLIPELSRPAAERRLSAGIAEGAHWASSRRRGYFWGHGYASSGLPRCSNCKPLRLQCGPIAHHIANGVRPRPDWMSGCVETSNLGHPSEFTTLYPGGR